jgi:hypothetical protein
MRSPVIAVLLLMVAAPVAAQETSSARVSDVASWREDLHTLAAELPNRHPKAFYRTPQSQFDSAVADLDRRLPALTRNQAVVGLMHIVALVHDGHTSLNPAFNPDFGFHYYPVDFYFFK